MAIFFWNLDHCLVVHMCQMYLVYYCNTNKFSQIRFNVVLLWTVCNRPFAMNKKKFTVLWSHINTRTQQCVQCYYWALPDVIPLIHTCSIYIYIYYAFDNHHEGVACESRCEKKIAAFLRFFLLIIVSRIGVKTERCFFPPRRAIVHLYLRVIFRPIAVHQL